MVGLALLSGAVWGLLKWIGKPDPSPPAPWFLSRPATLRATATPDGIEIVRAGKTPRTYARSEIARTRVRTETDGVGQAEEDYDFPVAVLEGRGDLPIWTQPLGSGACREIAEAFADALGVPYGGWEH